ncbi:MAG TPA: malto-oligosyltrehalose trehalohydrolase [Steroidobacteraceae bacterium]|nr:malto-oligosyltrehalose trehalohydrolase [Steroidobacteraceae bacterium]
MSPRALEVAPSNTRAGPRTRVHRMPFGAELTAERAVRFRLWAPAAQRVELALYEPRGTRYLEMPACGDGWVELTTDAAGPGTLYRYRIDGGLEVPDPASRFNPSDVGGPSMVVDPYAFKWTDASWRAPPWHAAVVYELHTGTFTPEGTFAAIEGKLGHLVELGITAIELMPIADFPGKHGWGYDGVLPFAPDSAYGTPGDLKGLICAAHHRGIAVMLDVVYNHFGPEGNFLGAYAPQFFTDRHQTPWGAAINFDGEASRTAREFYLHNALYWLGEYHLDGLRFDAVHAIRDASSTHILTEIARAVRAGPGASRPIYLVLENSGNEAHWLGAPGGAQTFDAQWNDDVHHSLHVLLTRESDGYYEDFVEHPHAMLCRALAEGFAYQGEFARHFGRARGEPSAHLPPSAFVNSLQTHDQIGNRALGERLAHLVRNEAALRAAAAIVLLAPETPMLFMGEEWDASAPFPYFCDFGPDLAAKVREGRRREFARFEKFRNPEARARLPDPVDAATVEAARLDWQELREPLHAATLDHYRRLLALRKREIVPRIPKIRSGTCVRLEENGAFAVVWALSDGSMLHLLANLTDNPVQGVGPMSGRLIFATHPHIRATVTRNQLEPWSVTWLLSRRHARR